MKILRIGSTKGENFTLLKNIDDVRRYVDNYFASIAPTVGLGDLSNLSVEAQSVLLKFVEETIDEIVCFASRDNINPVLMSRFDKVEKHDNLKIGTDSFSSFAMMVDDKEMKDVSLEREFVGKSAPYLDSFLIYRRLNRSMRSRIGHLL
jgi:hypothetical protein